MVEYQIYRAQALTYEAKRVMYMTPPDGRNNIQEDITMMKITGERKVAAARLAEITGERAIYTKMPRCAYEVGPYAIERDGSITASDSTDLAPLRTLAQEGLLEGLEQQAEETAQAPTEVQEAAPDALTISVPLNGHTAISLRNLVNMIYSRGELISKATDGDFYCPPEQVDALKDCLTAADVQITDALRGLVINDGKITFTGFPMADDPVKIRAFMQLAAQMNKAALTRKRVMAKAVDAANEKYIFRIWLLSLGMGGDDFKSARRILLAPLSGNTAFKDQAMEDRWKEKQGAKRQAQKVAEVTEDAVSE